MNSNDLPHRIEPEAFDAETTVTGIRLTVAELVMLHNAIVTSPEGKFIKERLLAAQLRGFVQLYREAAKRKQQYNPRSGAL